MDEKSNQEKIKMTQQYTLEEKERAIQLFQILGHYTWVIVEHGHHHDHVLLVSIW